MPGKILDHPAVCRTEPAGHIQDLLAAQKTDQPAEEPDAHPAHKAGLKPFFLDEPAADAHIVLSLQNRVHHMKQVVRVMLAVAVHLHGHIVPVVPRVLIPALNAAADT